MRLDDRAVFGANAFVLTSRYTRWHLPPTFGLSHRTARHPVAEWPEAGRGRGSTERSWTGSAATAA